MAPSRGLGKLRRAFLNNRKGATRGNSSFAHTAIDPDRKTQVYVSRTLDPYLNLSIEHFLLQKTPADSTVLFLYTNRPSIVIGRNQNPWVEVNLGLLRRGLANSDKNDGKAISLVRRRSGGGTVFHDEGNVNYSVICPTGVFDRDRHAQMVVRALHQLGVNAAEVNERHDIVLKQDRKHTVSTSDKGVTKPLKVSGSAYKLTRFRSLHHGTCLLSSPNLKNISKYLRSPAKPYIKARGVDSVSSPITNVSISNEAFENAVIAEFGMMYDTEEPVILGEETSQVPEIAKGLTEMRVSASETFAAAVTDYCWKSLEWTYMQTPQFTFSTNKTEDDPRARPALPNYVPPGVRPNWFDP
jgi:lipoate-protein ligase A